MNKTQKIVGIVLVLALLILSTVSVSALDASSNVSPFKAFLNNIFHSQSFTITGTHLGCGGAGGNAQYAWTVDSGKKLDGSQGVSTGSASAPDLSNFGTVMIDMWTNGWTPFLETRNFLTYDTCGTGPCNIQLYVCPYFEPTSQTDCNVIGGTFTSVTCPIWPGRTTSGGTPITAYKCPTETVMPYYKSSYTYCSEAVATHDCYYKPSGSSTCNVNPYSGVTSCSQVGSPLGYYNGQKLFEDRATCEASTCTPNNCASTTCAGQTCSDGCGGTQTGTKDCSTTCTPDNSGAANVCTTATFTNNCGTTMPGTKTDGECSEVVIDPDRLKSTIEFTVLEGPTTQDVLWSKWYATSPIPFKIAVHNYGALPQTFKVEAGFYTQDYAKDVAKLPTNNLFSLFGAVNQVENCVGSEGFIKTQEVTLNGLETKIIEIDQQPLFAYMTKPVNSYDLEGINLVAYIGIYKQCCNKLTGFEGCAPNTGGFLKDINGKEMYWTNWNFHIGDSMSTGTENIVCSDGRKFGELQYSYFGADIIKITKDYTGPDGCISYVFYNETGVDINATENQGTIKLSDIKKISIRSEDLEYKTNPELLLSACVDSKECLTEANLTAACIPISKLREQGLISQAKQTSFLEDSKTTIDSAVKGATFGGIAGWALCTITIGAASGGTLLAPAAVGCASAGALIGTGAGYIVSQNAIDAKNQDVLLEALSTKSASSVGICTATTQASYCKYTSWAAFFPITKNDCTDVLIITFGAVVLLALLFKR